ncbi:hypothetical protein [Sphingomonas glacialis]|nr:hypothetical protein [Sphingomonas glacialis]
MTEPLKPDPTKIDSDRDHLEALIDEAEEDSFPASDPPSSGKFD